MNTLFPDLVIFECIECGKEIDIRVTIDPGPTCGSRACNDAWVNDQCREDIHYDQGDVDFI